jgi:NADH-quinone oxidoreductase subunit C
MDPAALVGSLTSLVPGAQYRVAASVDDPTLYVPAEFIVPTLRAVRDTPEWGFTLLAELTAADYYPREPRFEVVYHLVSLGTPDFPRPGQNAGPARLRLKVAVAGPDPRVPTAIPVFACANWLEREVWDLFGIVFEGHPELHRLLTPDDWEGHPLRKDYPVQVRVPVNTQSALQLTTEEFVANIERRRAVSRER